MMMINFMFIYDPFPFVVLRLSNPSIDFIRHVILFYPAIIREVSCNAVLGKLLHEELYCIRDSSLA